MAIQLRLRRGTKAECRSLNGAQGELTYATDSKQIFVNDGSTTGNNKPFMDTIIAYQEPNAGNGYIWYRKYASGWVEQGGWGTAGDAGFFVQLPVPMLNTYYNIMPHMIKNGDSVETSNDVTPRIYNQLTTGFGMQLRIINGNGGQGNRNYSWYVSGRWQ